MAGVSHEDAAATFDPLRPKLMRVAYRMLGSVADAEDMVQEAFIRWMATDRGEVREPEAFLHRTVTRLSSISSSRRATSAKPMSARGFPIPSSKRRPGRTSPCR
jgi:RNA polymerase sigma-70 factor (ECF subfamily)